MSKRYEPFRPLLNHQVADLIGVSIATIQRLAGPRVAAGVQLGDVYVKHQACQGLFRMMNTLLH
jgi:hypothetical protein